MCEKARKKNDEARRRRESVLLEEFRAAAQITGCGGSSNAVIRLEMENF
jgi:hypothetical protein